MGPLLAQIDEEIEKIIADGAHVSAPTYQTIERHGGNIEVVIPPRKTAGPGTALCAADKGSRHLKKINTEGRLVWQTATGDEQPVLVETTMALYKSMIGPPLRSPGFAAQ